MSGRVSLVAAATLSCLIAGCGDSSTPNGPTGPVPTRWAAVTAGNAHACALDEGGRAFCWGENLSGQTGVTVPGPIERPTPVETELRFQEIDAGGDTTCGLATDDQIYCWGSNRVAQLGDAGPLDSTQPVEVLGDHAWTDVSVGTYHACGVEASGALLCWGGDRWDVALGYRAHATCPAPINEPTWPCSGAPREIEAGGRYLSVEAGMYHTCAVQTDGIAVCWGTNLAGQLGTPTETTCASADRLHPTERPCRRTPASPDGPPLLSIYPGVTHACGMGVSGGTYCWGGLVLNFGQVGNGTIDPTPAPVTVAESVDLVSVTTSHQAHIHTSSCGLDAGGAAFCWGANRFGQLGSETTEVCTSSDIPCSATPKPVAGGISFAALSLGAQFACGVDTTGQAFCWGINDQGQLGDGTRTTSFAPVRVRDPA